MKMRLPLAAMLIALFQSIAAHAAEPAPAEAVPENPYSKTYVTQSSVAAKVEPGELQIYLGKDKVTDYQRQLEKGYDILGYSSFEAGEVPVDKLKEQAAKVNADVVLVYANLSGKPPKSVKMDRAKSRAAEGSQSAGGEDSVKNDKIYSYFASYWTRMPPPLLGVNVRGTTESEGGKTGLVVLAVIEDSPAAAALRKGDILLRLGEVGLDQPQALGPAVQRYAGQTVEVEYERGGELQRAPLTLGRR